MLYTLYIPLPWYYFMCIVATRQLDLQISSFTLHDSVQKEPVAPTIASRRFAIRDTSNHASLLISASGTCFRAAADPNPGHPDNLHGDRFGQYRLGLMHSKGSGVPRAHHGRTTGAPPAYHAAPPVQ